ncbi:putative hydrolase of the HAD superfamily [Ruminococcaceae bacterium YRB3002]|nr:putative hydrolase of the HAD superfamily [Ruminococcaceae bacterium YRB3002]
MLFSAIVFDIGQTLTYYPVPLNWSGLYRPAFETVSRNLGIAVSEEEYDHIVSVLTRYNTRINPREKEVTSDEIFAEILDGTGISKHLLNDIKREFYSFFRTDEDRDYGQDYTVNDLSGLVDLTAR